MGRARLPSVGMSASLIGPSGSSAFRLSTTIVSMSLAGSCFSSESAPRPLYGVFFVKELARAAKLSFVGFLVRSRRSGRRNGFDGSRVQHHDAVFALTGRAN